jgi:YgiT-type zinc finger domain-containing protein
MICRNCGGEMHDQITDLPFKVAERSIVIIKDLPVSRCSACQEYLLAHTAMPGVERILPGIDQAMELEIVRHRA